MSRRKADDARFLDALEDLYIQQVLSASPEEFRSELLSIGENPESLAVSADAAFERAFAACVPGGPCADPQPAFGRPAGVNHGGAPSEHDAVADPFAPYAGGGLRGVARTFGCNLNFLGRLKDRLVRIEDLSAGFLASLAEALGTGTDDLARFLAGAPRVPSVARFKSDVKPAAVEKQSLADAVENSGLSDEQKRRLSAL